MSDVMSRRILRWMAAYGERVMPAAAAYAEGAVTASDIFQETLIKAWQKFDENGDDEPTGAWLCQAALSIGQAHARTAQRRRRLLKRWFFQEPLNPPPGIEDELGRRAMWRAIDELPPRQREALLLRIVDRLCSREIGIKMGITDGTVRAALRDAQMSLKTRLGAALNHDTCVVGEEAL